MNIAVEDLTLPTVMLFRGGGVPDEENNAAFECMQRLSQLRTEFDGFVAEIALIQHARQMMAERGAAASTAVAARWPIIAARSAVLRVAEIDNVLMMLSRDGRRNAAFRDDVDWQAVKQGQSAFRALYPHRVGTRNHAAHRTESEADPRHGVSAEHLDIGAVEMTNVTGIYIGGLFGDVYKATHDGEIVECDLSVNALKQVHEALAVTFTGFAAAEAAAKERRRSAFMSNVRPVDQRTD